MKTQCPNCKAKFSVSEQSVGKKAKCPKCAQGFTIEPFAETPVETGTKITEPVKAAEPPVEKKPESKKLTKTVYVYCWASIGLSQGFSAF